MVINDQERSGTEYVTYAFATKHMGGEIDVVSQFLFFGLILFFAIIILCYTYTLHSKGYFFFFFFFYFNISVCEVEIKNIFFI